MDPTSDEAIADYHRLLRDEAALREEIEERFLGRMREAGLTFGGRVLCPFPRPNLVSSASYHGIREACRAILSAVEKLDRALGETLWERVDLRPEERELVAIAPGYRRASPLARLDSFLTPASYQFVELNAETPAGSSYADALGRVFLELPLVRRFLERWRLVPFDTSERLLRTLLGCYREAGGSKERPTIAVVDYEDVPTRAEHQLVRAAFEARGFPSLVCDPRRLEYDGARLRQDGREIDVVYKRLLVNELLERRDELAPLVRAVRDRAVVVVNPFRCKPIHKKAIFDVLTDETLWGPLDDTERRAVRAHVPWTRRVREGRTQRWGAELDLPRFILDNRERLVLKPNDEYGGKGVFIGWETTATDWARALETALASSYVAQERVEVLRQTYPSLSVEGSGRAHLEFRELVVDLDPYLFDGEVEGFLTRLSGTSLANVTSGAGQVPSFLVEPLA